MPGVIFQAHGGWGAVGGRGGLGSSPKTRMRAGRRTYFRHHCQSQEIADEAHYGYKDLSAVALPQDGRVEIHDGGDLSFHFHKLFRGGKNTHSNYEVPMKKHKHERVRFGFGFFWFFVRMWIVFCLHEALIMRMRAAFVGQ